MDLIERQKAIEALKDWYDGMIISSFRGVEKVIKALPSAQPEIIYCRDCVHAIEDALCGGYWCKGKAVTSNHYCGYAERRTDGVDR